MSAIRGTAALRNLREQPMWRLLAALKAPVVLALLQELLLEGDKVLASSVLRERLTRELELLRARGEELPQTAQGYISDWLLEGWLTRRFPAGASEEEYELTADAASAVRFAVSLLQPRSVATESRLATVIHQLARLAEETDTDPRSRLATLHSERKRIEREIQAIQKGGVRALSDEKALERTREIIALTDELASDFRRVRDEFDRLNRELRENLVDSDGNRGEVLDRLFEGVDVISESDAGRTFAAFWRLLTDPEQSAMLEDSLTKVLERPFAKNLGTADRRFLLRLTRTLTDEGGSVHDVLQNFARSLKTFVQSREYQEQRRLHGLLKDALHLALEKKNDVRANLPLNYALTLTSSRIRSASQWSLYDPSGRMTDADMQDTQPFEISLDEVNELVRQSEIDFRTLKLNISELLNEQTQVSIRQLLERFPAEQGLGSVVGYIALGAKHGEITGDTEVVGWEGNDGVSRRARVPGIYFLKDRYADSFA